MSTFKGPGSSIEFQRTSPCDGEHDFVCYECNLVTANIVESNYLDGNCWLANAVDAMDHLRQHVAHGDMVPNDLIRSMQRWLTVSSVVHQSLMSPSRRKDGSHSGARESAFFAQWLHEQREDGQPPMYMSLLRSWGIDDWTPREVSVMASLIEWLGTNVGFCFLESALKRCGYKIVREKSDG